MTNNKQVPADYSVDVNPLSMSSTNTYNNDGIEVKVAPVTTDSVRNSVFSLEMTALFDTLNAGTYRVKFNARQYASGIYFSKMAADSKVKNMKMMMLK